MPPELSIIIPTYNERDNIGPLLGKLRAALAGIAWEAVYVDDNSPDGTAQRVEEEAAKDPRVRCLRRVGRKGLSSACIEGMQSSAAPYLAVMDADLQHDEKALPAMLEAVKREGLDIAVGSRYVEGGGIEGWTRERVAASRSATRFAQLLTGVRVEDPMSGFFLLRREFFQKCVPQLNGQGFKILLDIMMSSPGPVKFREVPYSFRPREHGESKLTAKVILEYFSLVFDKAMKRAPWLFWVLGLVLGAFVFLVVWQLAGLITGMMGTCPLRR